MTHPNSIPVTILGEKPHAESIELICELVNNAFDAGAAEVRVEIGPESIFVADDGSGTDYDGLVQYYNIGSPGKRLQGRSPRFHRVRIGQFGIGRFSSLTVARRLAQEIALMQGPRSLRRAFDLQSRILRWAFREEAKNERAAASQVGPLAEGV